MLMSDWRSDVGSSDLRATGGCECFESWLCSAAGVDDVLGQLVARNSARSYAVDPRDEDSRIERGHEVSSLTLVWELDARARYSIQLRGDHGERVGRELFERIAWWQGGNGVPKRSEEHTSELPSLMRSSYAVFCLKKKTIN